MTTLGKLQIFTHVITPHENEKYARNKRVMLHSSPHCTVEEARETVTRFAERNPAIVSLMEAEWRPFGTWIRPNKHPRASIGENETLKTAK